MKTNILRFCLLTLFLQTTLISEARADWNYTFIPTVSLGVEHDNNVYFTAGKKVDDTNVKGTFRFPFSAESPTTDIRFDYWTNRYQYQSEDNANYGNHFFNFDLSHALSRKSSFSLSERFSVKEDADRIVRSDTVEEAETGIIVERERRKTNTVTPSFKYSLSQRTALSLSLINSFTRATFKDFYDTSRNAGSLSLNYALDPKNSFSLYFYFGDTDYEREDRDLIENARYSGTFSPIVIKLDFENEFDESKTFYSTIGWSHQFSPTFDINLSVGVSNSKDSLQVITLVEQPGNDVILPNTLLLPYIIEYKNPYTSFTTSEPIFPGTPITFSDTQFVIVDDTIKNSGIIYNIGLNKQLARSNISLSANQDTYTRDTQGGTTERITYRASYTYRFSNRYTAYVNSSYHKNETELEGISDDKYQTVRTGVGVRYTISRNLSCKLSNYFTEQKKEGGDRIQRNLTSLTFDYSWPIER